MQGLRISNLTKSFGPHNAVDAVSLDINAGEFVCFLGPSGCGKTTLLRMIAGLEEPTSGQISLNGQEITELPTHARNFGMVFQSLALFPHLDVGDNIGYSLKLRGMDRMMRKERIAELLELVDLPDVARRPVSALSGGQRQRVAIARALAQEPRLFLMDEPLSALDAKLRDHMQVELRQLQKKLKITTIFVTHDQREAMTIADRIVVMSDGKIQQVGRPVDVYRNPANRFVANFIGQSNLFDVGIADDGHVSVQGLRVPADAQALDAVKAGKTTLCVRPEDVMLSRPGDRPGSLGGRVSFVRDLGSSVEIRLQCEDVEVFAICPPQHWNLIKDSERLDISVLSDASCFLSE